MTKQAWLTRKQHEHGVVELELGRAPVNALSPQFLMDFADEMVALGNDDGVRAIVLSSPFKVFSAGLDLKEAQSFDRAQQNDIVKGLNFGFLAQYACPKPVVAAVGGAAIAGGLFYVLASDFRVAGPRASFGLAEVRVGADFPVGPFEIARATLDSNTQRRLMLTGQPIGAQDAQRAGVVDVVTDETGDVMSCALGHAQTLGQLPPKTYASIKRQLRGATIACIEAAMAAGGNDPEDGWFTDETVSAMQRMIG
ncbi:enoyl-CoA hydratase/isomerase family protein [Aliisedimentitalea scapharcae]|uniref:Enoyl-CoA hydratase/isomerase family protein n=1 Tax=Aliisedimentitalea scapharcae TaxID=1524259 RepID=A0ABZ2XPE1_9RHOB